MQKRAGSLLLVAAVVAAVTYVAISLRVQQPRSAPQRGEMNVVPVGRAVATQQEEAEAAAIRALVAVLPSRHEFDLEGRAQARGAGWSVQFTRFACHGTGCRRTRGTTWVDVSHDDGVWRVTAVRGDVTPAVRKALLGTHIRLPEAPQWEFVHRPLRGDPGRFGFLWVGPIPYSGPGSSCRLVGLVGGERVHREPRFYFRVPREPLRRSGGLLSQPLRATRQIERHAIRCRPLRGAGWVPAAPATILPASSNAVYVSAPLQWQGERVLRPESRCDAILRDRRGNVLAQGFQHIRGVPARISQVRFRLDVPDPTAATTATIACRLW